MDRQCIPPAGPPRAWTPRACAGLRPARSLPRTYWRRNEGAEKFQAAMRDEHPQQRCTLHEGNIGLADDCRLVVAADQSAYITGQIWAVNGGMDM